MSEIRPRVTGTEMEWPVGLRKYDNAGFHQAVGYSLEKLAYFVTKRATDFNGFLVNGGRCYRDGDMLEYATGEEDTFMGTVAAEIAGEQLVRDALKRYIANEEDVTAGQLLKRVHHASIGCGYHVNLCADAETCKLNQDSLYELGLWAATAALYNGAGCMYSGDSEGSMRFSLGQKTLGVRQGFSGGTTGSMKPLVCLRDEPHGDPERFQRIQIVGLDPNISPWASWMTLGTASLCLRAIEQNRRLDHMQRLYAASPSDEPLARLAKNVALSPNLDAVATLDDGTTIRAIDIQRELYSLCETTDHTNEESAILQDWKKTLDDVDGDRSFIKRKTGWAVRQRILEHRAKKHGVDMLGEEIAGADRSYDDNRDGGMSDTLRGKIWKDDMPDEDLIKDRMENPCQNTRAVVRSNAIKDSGNYQRSTFGWSSYQHEGQRKVLLKDPLVTTIPEYQDGDDRYSEPGSDDEDDTGLNARWMI